MPKKPDEVGRRRVREGEGGSASRWRGSPRGSSSGARRPGSASWATSPISSPASWTRWAWPRRRTSTRWPSGSNKLEKPSRRPSRRTARRRSAPLRPKAKAATTRTRRPSPGSAGSSDRSVRRRLDVEMVRRGLAASRTEAAMAVGAGQGPGGRPPGAQVRRDGRARPTPSCSRGPHASSSRAAARSSTPRSIGSRSTSRAAAPSTRARRPGGSPTACSPAAPPAVVAVDVGYGQLDWGLAHGRARDRHGADERPQRSSPAMLPYRPDVVTADLSFISLGGRGARARAVRGRRGRLRAAREAAVRGRAARRWAPGAWCARATTGAGRWSVWPAPAATPGLAVRGVTVVAAGRPGGNVELFLWASRAGRVEGSRSTLERALDELRRTAGVCEPRAIAAGDAGRRSGAWGWSCTRGGPAAVEAARSLAGWLGERGRDDASRAGRGRRRDRDARRGVVRRGPRPGGVGGRRRDAAARGRAREPRRGAAAGREGGAARLPDRGRARGGARPCSSGRWPATVHIEERMAIVAEADGRRPGRVDAGAAVGAQRGHRREAPPAPPGHPRRRGWTARRSRRSRRTASSSPRRRARPPTRSRPAGRSSFPGSTASLLTPVSPHMVFDRLDRARARPDRRAGGAGGGARRSCRPTAGPGIEMPLGRARPHRARRAIRPGWCAATAAFPSSPCFGRSSGSPTGRPADPTRRDSARIAEPAGARASAPFATILEAEERSGG